MPKCGIPRCARWGALLIVAAGCGPPDAASAGDAPPSSDPFFVLTVSGPAFSTPQTFRVPPERVFLNLATAGGFVIRYHDADEPVPSEDGTFFLRMFNGGIGPGELTQPGTYSHGPIEEGVDGWGTIIWPAPCLENRSDCRRIRMRTVGGTLEVTRYDQGKAISRPHAEGPTAIAAETDLIAEGQERNEGKRFTIEWAFHLIDAP